MSFEVSRQNLQDMLNFFSFFFQSSHKKQFSTKSLRERKRVNRLLIVINNGQWRTRKLKNDSNAILTGLYVALWGGGGGGGLHSTLASYPAAPDLILGILKNFSLDVAEIY